jgi:hypothetical protein
MGAARYFWLVFREALAESLDRAQAILFLAIIAAGGVIAMLPQFAQAHHFQDAFESLLSWKGAALILGAVVAARVIVAPYRLWKHEVDKVEELESRLAPKIRLWFDPSDAGIQLTPVRTISNMTVPAAPSVAANIPAIPGRTFQFVHDHQASYVRIQAATLSDMTVTGCLAHLTAIEKVEDNGAITPIRLPHGVSLYDAPREVQPHVPFAVDFLACDSRDNKLTVPASAWPFALADAFVHSGAYRFTIVMTCGGISHSIRVEIDWRGQWDTISGRQIPL